MSIRVGPCEWPLVHCGESSEVPTCTSLAGLSDEVREIVVEAATGYLWRWTGKKYGTCPITVRPCREECWRGSTYYGPGAVNQNLPWFGGAYGMGLQPALIGGAWFNMACGECAGRCSCKGLSRVDLAGPVDAVTGVMLDGVSYGPDDGVYVVDNNRWLSRVDGGKWPTCQDQSTPTSESGSFEVTYTLGVPVPAGGKLAAAQLACEMAKAICLSTECRLPQRIQTITRQGVTTAVLDSFADLYERGTTGLTMVDMWVASENATVKGSGRARIASPDTAAFRRVTS